MAVSYAGESDSDDDGSSAHQLQKDALASTAHRPSSANNDTLTGGSTSVSQPLTDTAPLADANEQSDESQLQGNAVDISQSHAQSQGQGWSLVQSQAQTQSQTQSESQGQSPVQSHGHAQSHTQPSHPAMHMTGVDSPFLDRLAAADGAQTPQGGSTAPQHAGQHSRHSDTHSQDSAQPATWSFSPAPDQATGVHSEANQATDSSTQEAAGRDELLTGAFSHEEDSVNQQYDVADPVAGDQTLASNLAFQQELQQRSSERHARAGPVGRDRSDDQHVGERGGQEGGHRGLRYFIELVIDKPSQAWQHQQNRVARTSIARNACCWSIKRGASIRV